MSEPDIEKEPLIPKNKNTRSEIDMEENNFENVGHHITNDDNNIEVMSKTISIANTNDSLGITRVERPTFYRLSIQRLHYLGIPLGLLTVGILPLLSIWILDLQLYLFYTKIPRNKLLEATHVRLVDSKGHISITTLHKRLNFEELEDDQLGEFQRPIEDYEIKFIYRYITYFYDHTDKIFSPIKYNFAK